MNNAIIGVLENMILALPDDEIRNRFIRIGLPNEKIDFFMNCIDNSCKKNETPSGDSDK